MNRGTFQSFPVQQIMASDDSNWWIINNSNDHHGDGPSPPPFSLPSLLPSYFLFHHQQPQNSPSSSTSNSPSIPLHTGWPSYLAPEQFPDSWRHLLAEGLVGEDEIENFQARNMMNWEELLHQSAGSSTNSASLVGIKREILSTDSFTHRKMFENFNPNSSVNQSWSSSSPTSCVTNFFNGDHSMMEFASSINKVQLPSDGCSNPNGGKSKKARLHPSASQQAFKVRKEKLGDRINALHQLVSPFGKTDTASVLLEAIGYIRFLQNQIEALSSPYMGNASKQQKSFNEGVKCLFSDESNEEGKERKIDLSSKGLCLVPISCTLQVGSDNGADYWAPAFGGLR